MTTYPRKGPMFNPPHPGEHLKEDYMVPLGITTEELATCLGRSRATISRLINGRGRIDIEIACALAKAFETTPGIWLRLQQKHDEWIASQQPEKAFAHIPSFRKRVLAEFRPSSA